MRAPDDAHGTCGISILWSVSGLLDLMQELLDNPGDERLTGPTGQLKSGAGDTDVGGRGKGRGRRGRGRKRGGGGWKAYPAGMGMFGGSPKGISSKWVKGTGYGGGGNEMASTHAQAVAHEAEERADRAMAAILDGLTSCLPRPKDFPEHLPALVALVRESSLLQTVCAYLRNDSLMDIAQRSDLYFVSGCP